jgi:benzoyl-CoA reductase subunit C
MQNELLEAATVLYNSKVKKWKDNGNKVVGYTCSYLPDEIFHAAGILTYRLRGTEAGDTTIGDTYFGPFICSLPKCLLQLAGEGKYDFLDGAIIIPGCDSMRRLDECWRKAGEDYSGAAPDFFFYYGVPHKTADFSLKWFIDETRRLISEAEEHFSVKITDEKLRDAIKIYNKGRTLIHKFDEIRMQEKSVISGSDSLAVILAGTAMPREDYNSLLEDLISELEKKKKKIAGRKRLMLVGSANDDIELVKLIEGESAIVIADNLCFGSRTYVDLVEEKGDPVEALAERYLNHNDCPRMFGDYKKRLNVLKEKIERGGIEGVVLQNIRFCDLHGSENGIFERDLEAIGVPCIRIEREYGPLVESGRIKMRIDAFLERVEAGGKK